MHVRLTEKQKIKIQTSDNIYKVMQQVLLRENQIRRNQEHFWVVGLNNQNKILFIELVSLGTVNGVQINPPEVFRMAIYKLAVRIVLVHNHPSGEMRASESDKDVTDRLLKVGCLINIEVMDHLIISETDYLSFADDGILEELRNTGRYEIMDTEKVEMRKWSEEVERERAIREYGLLIAKKMVDDQIDIDTILKYTGLKKRDLKRIQD